MCRKIAILVVILVAPLIASSSPAATILSLQPMGDSAYQLQAAALDGAAGLDVTLSYNPSVLTAPQVVQGPLLTGAMMAVNPNTPGIVRISAVTLSPMRGSGALLTITFTRGSGGQGILNLAARLIDLSGKPLAAQVQLPAMQTASDESGASGSGGTASVSGSAAVQPPAGTGIAGPVVGVVIPAPADRPAVGEERKPVPEPEAVPPESKSPVRTASRENSPDRPEAKSKAIYTQPSILDRFREFRGERTMQACRKIFDQEALIGFQQNPKIVLADGVATATVQFISTPDRERTSDLALMGAKLVGSKRDAEATNSWIVTILPEKGSDRVTLSVPQKDLLMIYPLTVAPKVDIDLDRSGTVTEADFALFLRERGTAKAPAFDLNRDGVRDYRDDFIFTANYLSAQQAAPGKGK